MKNKLIILSLSPLFLLILINNFVFSSYNELGVMYTKCEFIYCNAWILLVEIFSALWLIFSMFILFEFKCFLKYDITGGFEIISVVEDKEAGLNFFLTLIVPLLLEDLNIWQNAMALLFIVICIYNLLTKTDLYYANPVLVILGFKCYKFEFKENDDFAGKYYGISRTEVNENSHIKYKIIDGNVLYLDKN